MERSYLIDYKRWGRLIVKAQLIIASVVFLVEIIANTLLYVTRSQGYSPETIVAKLLRYLVLTSIINFGVVIISKVVNEKATSETKREYFLMFLTVLMCTDVAYSHYQFSVCFAIYVIPIMIGILYENTKLSIFTLAISLTGQLVAIIARAVDPDYSKDIGPEAAISISLTISAYIFALIITTTLSRRRAEAKEAVIKAEKASANAEKMAFSFKMLETLAGTIDAKDKYTNGHSVRVAIYATKLAEAIGWDEESVTKLRYEALLHDIGKIGVPDLILNKPSRLSEMEFELIKSHTVIGSDILKNMVAVPNAYEVARHHHERYDGNGYPSGLKGIEIPLSARIVCIADAYDAMSSDRIYRKALPKEAIRKELIQGRGTQFDPELLDIFLNLFEDGKLVLSNDTLFAEQEDEQQPFVIEDIDKVIRRITVMDEYRSDMNEFDKFYKYMRNIGLRYNRSIEVLSIDILSNSEEESYDSMNDVSDILQIAIRKNIRSVDVYYRYSPVKHMIILLDAGVDNVDVVKNRIKYDFESSELSNGYSLNFELSESVDSSGNAGSSESVDSSENGDSSENAG